MQLNAILATTALLGTALCAETQSSGPCPPTTDLPTKQNYFNLTITKFRTADEKLTSSSGVTFDLTDPGSTEKHPCVLAFKPKEHMPLEGAPGTLGEGILCGRYRVDGIETKEGAAHFRFTLDIPGASAWGQWNLDDWRSSKQKYSMCSIIVPVIDVSNSRQEL